MFLDVNKTISKSRNWKFVIDEHSDKSQVNPFNQLNELSFENRVAYFNYFFDSIILDRKPHELPGLYFGYDVLELFGLTPKIVSAMQIIITEELGFNPHSIYEAAITSSERGEVYILINDEGGVRVKFYKRRARRIREVTAKGKNNNLSTIEQKDIGASECFKIAIEMGERTRKLLKTEKLWTCLLLGSPSGLPSFTTFQSSFNDLSNIAYEKSGLTALKKATLKKVRSSKGVLIYLETNGDILKVTNYFGNTVKTALKSYIPTYLSELVYRIKIRAFQNILLYMSIAKHDAPFITLDISESFYTKQLEEAFRNSDFNGPLAKKLIENPEQEKSEAIYFCLSNKNLVLALKYIKEGNNHTLRDLCVSVINKVSEGPTQLKEMLRNAQIYSEMQSQLDLGSNYHEE